METFLRRLRTIPQVRELIGKIRDGGCPVSVTGLQAVHRACVGAAVAQGAERPVVFVCGGEREARQLASDLRSLTGEAPALLLSRDLDLRPGSVGSRDRERARIGALWRMASARTAVATADALLLRTLSPALLRSLTVELSVGGRADLASLTGRLVSAGYVRVSEVEGPGQFAVRGGILDVWSPQADRPVRCDLFDDEIDSMGEFDPAGQRRTGNIDTALLLPAAEVLPWCAEGGLDGLASKLEALASRCGKRRPTLAEVLRGDAADLRDGVVPEGLDRYLAAVYPDGASGADHVPRDAVVFVCEHGRVGERIASALVQGRQDAEVLMEAGILAGELAKIQIGAEELWDALSSRPVVMASALPTSRHPLRPRALMDMDARQLSSYGGSLEAAAADLEQYRRAGTAVLALCATDGRARDLHRLLEERKVPAALSLKKDAFPAPGQVLIALGGLSAGSEWPQLGLAVLTEGQFAPERPAERRPSGGQKGPTNRQKIRAYTDLVPGDLVVHARHGVGRFEGMERMPVDGVSKDYIKIAYAGGDCLYVPATQLDQVSKYIGGGGGEAEGRRPRIDKLGGSDWARRKGKARKAVRDLAKGLTQLYAERQRRPGHAFAPDSPWQREFEDAFPYEETEDQLRASEEIKRDMESPRPMDRLLCGDVGYGKTEVALRAVMKCILDGKQAAVLAPTTVLAQQHAATALERFRGFPVTVEVLSRFTSPKDVRRILEAVRLGGVDLLIGTHKLLGRGVAFRDLGLLVIDEEQRFGVAHKERLKEMSRQVDVLTLSATPIPRTLDMALSGLRDMSTIEEPPAGRQPVQTYVLEHDWGILTDALRRELDRGGQVYWLHNRTETIDRTAAKVRELLGDQARVAVGHGRMGERELSDVMRRMVDGEADVLVCTTIIETGIDIPNVNTLVIEDADRLGLSQLHQIRGRIGRSARRAYAYLTYRPGKILEETAAKRLSAIREYVEFGSGFKIAMRDLEIRGAGDLLGAEQSGHLMSVGYDLYLKLLEEAVLEKRGETRPMECAADLTIDANIPESYVPDGGQRMDLYRKIAAVRSQDDASDVLDELLDRYGDPPAPVRALLDVALLRSAAAAEGISDVSQKGDELRLTIPEPRAEAVLGLCGMEKYRRRLALSAGGTPSLALRLPRGADPLAQARELVSDLHAAGEKGA